MASLLKAAWRYRGFVASSILNDYRSRLARSKLGTLWVVLQPLAQALIFAVVLSQVLAARLPDADNKYAFVVYLLSGLLCWSLFAEIVQRCLSVFIDNGSLLKKLQFPRITLPIIVAGTALVSNVALLAVLLVLIPLTGIGLHYAIIWFPVMLMLTMGLALGIGLLLGTLNVFMRDIGQFMAVFMQFWFWMTPVAYPSAIVPAGFKRVLEANPVSHLVMGYHDIFLYGRSPAGHLAQPALAMVLMLIVALVLFRRASPEIVDAL